MKRLPAACIVLSPMEATGQIMGATTPPKSPDESADPIVRLSARLEELRVRIDDLSSRHRKVDVLAGRLALTLEAELKQIEDALKSCAN
jgi:hypothetical protein